MSFIAIMSPSHARKALFLPSYDIPWR